MSRTEKRLAMGKAPVQPGMLAHESPAARRIGGPTIKWSSFAAAALTGALGVVSLAAQEPPRIRVAPTIVAAANSQAALAIEIGPPSAVPPRAFLNLRGVPPTVALVDGHAIDPGSWAVSLATLPVLKAIIPPGLSGQSEITISLIAMDGRLLTQAKTTLVIQGSSDGAASERPPSRPPPVSSGARASAPERIDHPSPTSHEPGPVPQRQRPLAPQERERALALLKKGEELFAAGNVGAARLFYERAADAGLAEGALALAATFDPGELARRKVLGGVQPDLAVARRWYERARALGALEAENHLRRLGAAER